MVFKSSMRGFWLSIFVPLSLLCFFLFASPLAWALGRRPTVHSETLTEISKPPPLTLRESYEQALQRSETVAIQKEEIKEAEAQFFKAASEALGDVNFVMTDSRQENQGGGEGTVANSFVDPERSERKFIIKQPLFQGFKALGALSGAGSLRKTQKEEWLRAQELLFLDAARAFYGLLREKKDLEIVEAISLLFRERIKELTEREQIGRSRASEVTSAKARMKLLEAERSRIQGALALAQNLLEFLTGIPLEGRPLLEGELPQEEPKTLALYLQAAPERSDVRARRESVKSAWRGVIVAQSGFWPELSLESNQYRRREGLQANINWDLLFKIDVPLFRGGENVGKLKEAVSRWKKEKLAYSLAERRARLEIQDSYGNWLASLDESRALQEAVKSSEENFRLQREEYAHNLVSNLEVLQALESFYETRREANHAHYQMKENYWSLQVASGGSLNESRYTP